jgi:Uma2 family endonuclease
MPRGAMEIRRWRRVEYERLIDAGVLPPDEPVELMGGHLVVAEPQGSYHFATIRAVEEALRAAFGPGWDVRVQGPLALDDDSEPEPDVAVVPGSFRDYLAGHPSRPVLVVEVSEASLDVDRDQKAGLYARAGVADYWIVNLVEHVVEVHRGPAADPHAAFGWRYQTIHRAERQGSVAPLAAPGASVRVVDLIP